MSPLPHLFPRPVRAATLSRLALHLPSAAPPDKTRLRRLYTSIHPPLTCDWLHWSLYQDKQTQELWLQAAGGIANITTWYGPGDPSLAQNLHTP